MLGLRRPAWLVCGAAVALAASLPFVGVLEGGSLFFRDLSLGFFPLMRFMADGAAHGELRQWNPYLHEGVPVTVPPFAYPLDVLHLLWSDDVGLSAALVLHIPLAALAFVALARTLGIGPLGAAAGGLVYGLGGFALSTINLFVYARALPWPPLFLVGVLALVRGRRFGTGLAAIALGLCLATTAAEMVLQAIVWALVIAACEGGPRGSIRVLPVVALGVGLAAYPLLVMSAVAFGGARGEGFPPQVVLAQSVHPLTWLQVVIGKLHGDPANLTQQWWGQNFFPMGFPYILSLYLGGTTLAAAAVGLRYGGRTARAAALLAALAIVVCLGRWAGLEPLLTWAPRLNVFRYPVKAFYTVHLAAAALCAWGLNALASSRGRAWVGFATLGAAIGGVLAALPALAWAAPAWTSWFFRGFLPPGSSEVWRSERARIVLVDAATGGGLALLAVLVAAGVITRKLRSAPAGLAVALLIAADLLRVGLGVNPLVAAARLRPSPEVEAAASTVRASGRSFSCEPEFSHAFHRVRREMDRPDVWTLGVYVDTLTPSHNMRVGVRSAYGRDLTMMVPANRLFDVEEMSCAAPARMADRLRRAGVSHVLSITALSDPGLQLEVAARPARVAPLAVHVYRLPEPLPLRVLARSVSRAEGAARAEALAARPGFQEAGGVVVEGDAAATAGASGRVDVTAESAGSLEMAVESDRPSVVLIRDAYAPGWTATVDGRATPVLRANGRHRAVAVPAGRSRVRLAYRAPMLLPGLALSALSLVGVAASLAGARRRR